MLQQAGGEYMLAGDAVELMGARRSNGAALSLVFEATEKGEDYNGWMVERRAAMPGEKVSSMHKWMWRPAWVGEGDPQPVARKNKRHRKRKPSKAKPSPATKVEDRATSEGQPVLASAPRAATVATSLEVLAQAGGFAPVGNVDAQALVLEAVGLLKQAYL